MTLQEASRQFHLKIETLRSYEKKGLLQGTKTAAGAVDYPESEIQKASQFLFLEKAGMNLEALKHFVALRNQETDTTAEQIRILRKYRYRLLEEIHGKQQALDQLDYLLYEIKKGAFP